MDPNAIAGTAIAILAGVVITIVAARVLEKKTDLTYRIVRSDDLVPADSKVPLEIRYGGTPVKHLVQVRCVWTNRGNVPLQHIPIKATMNTTGEIASIVTPDPERVSLDNYQAPTAAIAIVPMTIVLLNPGERGTTEWLVTDDPHPELVVTARALGVVARPDTPSGLEIAAEWAPTVLLAMLTLGSLISTFYLSAALETISTDPTGARERFTIVTSVMLPLMGATLALFAVRGLRAVRGGDNSSDYARPRKP